jgi:hypothetical protein
VSFNTSSIMEPEQISYWHRNYRVTYFGNINTTVHCWGNIVTVYLGTLYLYILETCISIFRKPCSSKVLLLEKWLFSICIWSAEHRVLERAPILVKRIIVMNPRSALCGNSTPAANPPPSIQVSVSSRTVIQLGIGEENCWQ